MKRAVDKLTAITRRRYPLLRKHLESAPPEVQRELTLEVRRLIRDIEEEIDQARRRGERNVLTGRAR